MQVRGPFAFAPTLLTWPSTLHPQVYTSPLAVTATLQQSDNGECAPV